MGHVDADGLPVLPHLHDGSEDQVDEKEAHEQSSAGEPDGKPIKIIADPKRLEILLLRIKEAFFHLVQGPEKGNDREKEENDARQPERGKERERSIQPGISKKICVGRRWHCTDYVEVMRSESQNA